LKVYAFYLYRVGTTKFSTGRNSLPIKITVEEGDGIMVFYLIYMIRSL